MQFEQKRVLVCPLNWGLGHATRCIPIINELLVQGAEVILAGNGDSLLILQNEFPQLKYVTFSAKEITYPNKSNMSWHLFKSSVDLLLNIFSEHRQLKQIINEHYIDIVISDNRYGCWSTKCFSIFITHQLNIQCPTSLKWLQPFVNRINHFFIRKYNECWVPDVKELPGLSGILSHGDYYLQHVKYIGALSRFTDGEAKTDDVIYDLLVILSGPEPQRTIFENLIIEQVSKLNLKTLLVRGKPQKTNVPVVASQIKIINHLETSQLKFHLQHAKNILCRSGYSTIMDLAMLGRKAIIVPTPGQTEQEYLAGFFHLQKVHFMQQQNQFDLKLALKGIEFCNELKYNGQENTLTAAISRVLSMAKN